MENYCKQEAMERFAFPDKIDKIALKLLENNSYEKNLSKNILTEAHFYVK